uniref:lipid II:glycine glycyltransferase FemX n=1 Tax=Algoriphagus sp. TaxID=1872435 RepID=UPI00258D085E|nr:peptidoglycan bridge formation glycyltransferase FemA/FemB family protein [Algoriphagus sp.]
MDSKEKLVNPLGWFVTTEKLWLRKWDLVQKSHHQGMFTQTSSWLSSYRAYGFSYELLIKTDSLQNIVAGFGCLLIKAGPFKVYFCPWGPFLSDSVKPKEALDQFVQRAIQVKASVAQFNPPVFTHTDNWTFLLKDKKLKRGNFLKKIYVPLEFNLISLPDPDDLSWENNLLKSFSENAKRNIKASKKFPIEIKPAKTPSEIAQAYACFQNNADREGYSIRTWEDVKESLTDAVIQENSIILLAVYEEKVVGAIWCAYGGNMLSYIMGGVDRSEKDLKLGHLLQWTCMQLAVQHNFPNYNISVGGSEGVVRFKSSFYPKQVSSVGPYHLVLQKLPYVLFKFLFPYLEKNKTQISRILKYLN